MDWQFSRSYKCNIVEGRQQVTWKPCFRGTAIKPFAESGGEIQHSQHLMQYGRWWKNASQKFPRPTENGRDWVRRNRADIQQRCTNCRALITFFSTTLLLPQFQPSQNVLAYLAFSFSNDVLPVLPITHSRVPNVLRNDPRDTKPVISSSVCSSLPSGFIQVKKKIRWVVEAASTLPYQVCLLELSIFYY